MTIMEAITRRSVVAGSLAAALTSPVRAQSAKKDVCRITMVQGLSGLVLHEIAKAQGFFDKSALEPDMLLVADGTKATAAVLSGAAEICMWSGFNQVPPAIEKGAKLKILAGALNLAPLALYSKDKSITKVEDLVGKTIGIGPPGAVMHQMISLLLQKKGIDLGKITWRNVGATPDIFKAVVAGTVDAGVAEVDMYERQEHYGVHALSNGQLWAGIPEHTNQATYASDSAIATKRDVLVRTLAVYGQVYRYVTGPNSRDAYIAARKVLTSQDDPQEAITYWNFIQQYKPYNLELALTDDRLTFVQELNKQFGVQQRILSIPEVSDMSLARDAYKLLT